MEAGRTTGEPSAAAALPGPAARLRSSRGEYWHITPRPARRLTQLFSGLVLYGASDALLVRARLGLDPWDVFHQGLSRHTGLAIGTWSIIIGAAVLLLWIPLRQMPGFGTVCNAVIIGLTLNLTLSVVAAPQPLVSRAGMMVAGVVLNGVATGCYIGAGLGPGPRDGLMVGISARGHSLRVVRTCIELTVLCAGWLMGGTVGIGTVAYALGIGPLAHVLIPLFSRGLGRTSSEPEQSRTTPNLSEAERPRT